MCVCFIPKNMQINLLRLRFTMCVEILEEIEAHTKISIDLNY